MDKIVYVINERVLYNGRGHLIDGPHCVCLDKDVAERELQSRMETIMDNLKDDDKLVSVNTCHVDTDRYEISFLYNDGHTIRGIFTIEPTELIES